MLRTVIYGEIFARMGPGEGHFAEFKPAKCQRVVGVEDGGFCGVVSFEGF